MLPLFFGGIPFAEFEDSESIIVLQEAPHNFANEIRFLDLGTIGGFVKLPVKFQILRQGSGEG